MCGWDDFGECFGERLRLNMGEGEQRGERRGESLLGSVNKGTFLSIGESLVDDALKEAGLVFSIREDTAWSNSGVLPWRPVL